jgi:hypothetical protein
MNIIIAIVSVLGIAGIAAVANRLFRFHICPVCAGVSGTWAWMLVVRALGTELDTGIILLLMGGSVVGITYQVERKFEERVTPLLKLLLISAGFIAAYAVVMYLWTVFVVATVACGASLLLLGRRSTKGSRRSQGLEKQMEQCC